MSDNWIGIEVINNNRIADILKRLPKPVGDAVSDSIAEYMIDVYKHYPPYKYVSRKRAFGRTFESARQRRYFFWALQKGIIKIGNHRTQKLSRGWRQIGTGQDSIIANEVSYSPFVQGEELLQSRMMGIIGWERFDEAYDKRLGKPSAATYGKVIFGAVKKAIKKMGLESD